MQPHPTLKGFACIFFSILVWAGWMVSSRYAVKGSLTAADITALRFGTAGILLLPLAFKRGLAAGPWGWKSGLLLALLIGAPYTNVAVAGMVYAPASHAATVINGVALAMTTFLGIRALREETTRMRLAGVGCSLAGVACIFLARDAGGSPQQWVGHVFFIIAGCMWGGYIVLVRAWKIETFHAAAVVCVWSLLIYLPLYLIFAHSHITWENRHEVIFQSLYQGVLNSIIAFAAFNAGVHLLGASRAGALTPLVPALATLLAVPVLHEIPSTLEWAGVAAVSFGVFLSSGALRLPPNMALLRREMGD